jgi:hypothetical protein
LAGSRSIATAYTAATPNPVHTHAARIMCTTWCGAAGATSGAIGSAETTTPFSSTNPTGVFIHALAVVTNSADAMPDTATGTPVHQCARGGSRSHPYRYSPRKMASRKNANASSVKASPNTPP